MPAIRFTVNGQEWELRFVRKIQSGGDPCYAKADYAKRIIRVERGLTGALLVSSISHELYHANAPNVLDCEFIDKVSENLGELLTHPEVRGRI